jgi:hypothetical protein
LKNILDSNTVRDAIARLKVITEDLEKEAERLKKATDTINTVAGILERATKIIGLLGAFA